MLAQADNPLAFLQNLIDQRHYLYQNVADVQIPIANFKRSSQAADYILQWIAQQD